MKSKIMTLIKGTKNPVRFVGDNEKCFYTVNHAGSADGQYTPPFIIFKSKSELVAEWQDGAPAVAQL